MGSAKLIALLALAVFQTGGPRTSPCPSLFGRPDNCFKLPPIGQIAYS
jgi:hypothetical protein